MFFWGIKEIKISKKSDEDFARCKKTCGFVMALKFLFFFYNLFVLVAMFLFSDFSVLVNYTNAYVGVPYLFQISLALITILSFVMFIVPVVAFSKAAKFLKNDGNEYYQNENSQNFQQNGQYSQNEQIQNQNNMEEGQPTYYDDNQTRPLDPSSIIMPQQEDPNAINIIPGQNGVPETITEKGLDDLVRLERLHMNGAIDDQNYLAMKKIIFQKNS